MPTYYKLTSENDRTYGGCQWGLGVTHITSGEGELCSSGWTHWYTHPLLAVLLNPMQGNFNLNTAHLWRSPKNQEAQKFDHGLKVGCMRGITVKRIKLPILTTIQKIAFGILCTLEVYKEKSYHQWAESWLSGKNRSMNAAKAARAAAAEAVEKARAAVRAARAAEAAAVEEARAARAAVWVARAARAVEAEAAAEIQPLNLISIAKKSLKVK